jgi:hypothetical protein
LEAGADGLLIYPFTEIGIAFEFQPMVKLIRAENKKQEALKKLEENENYSRHL